VNRIVFLLALSACGGSQVSEKRQPAKTVEAGPMGCVEDAAAKNVCADKGDAWQYSYPAERNCGGAMREPEPPAPAPICECIEKTEYARLQQQCAEAP
jgi:hypothetical protein